MDYVYGLFVYEHAACFDFTGPLDVFNRSNSLVKKGRVLTIAAEPGGVRCSGGLEVLPSHTIENVPVLDVLLVPGTEDTELIFSDNDPIKFKAEEKRWRTAGG